MILIFSDTHLTPEFDQKKFEIYAKKIADVEKVIILGDFWEGFKCSFDDFVNSKWQKLFPLLKEKKTIYIYGNHDPESFSDERVNLFSDKQAEFHQEIVNNKKFTFTHGHLLAPSLDVKYPHIFNYSRIINIGDYLEKLGYRIWDKKFLKSIFNSANSKLKIVHKEKNDNSYLVCGHSHLQEITLDDKFINVGVNKLNLFEYLIINKDGTPDLNSELLR